VSEQAVGAAYDARADEYVARFGHPDRLADVDLTLVRRWRDSTSGRLLDAGCGPGQWTQVLQAGGRPVLGLDRSAQLLTAARRNAPGLPFVLACLAALPLRTASCGGVLAWFSVIHTPPAALPAVLAELARVLRPDGSLLVGFFGGEPGVDFAHAVTTAYSWSVEALGALLGAVGLEVVEHQRRDGEGHGDFAALVARPTRTS
jgi:SAM-dependent methyltransferase